MKNLARKSSDGFDREWINENALDILAEYDEMTLRQLYYRLVARGMTNSLNHYKRVVNAMTEARWNGIVGFDAFIDREREPACYTDIEVKNVDSEIEWSKTMLKHRITSYNLNRWSNQPVYVEVMIEKKALQGVFEGVCSSRDVGLLACKGYASLTALYEAYQRFLEAEAEGKELVILYFGDHDPSGDDIPRSLIENMARMGVRVELDRRALTREQVIDMNLPPAPTKASDTRSANWDGLGQVELDAIDPKTLEAMCREAIDEYFDRDLYDDLIELETEQKDKYQKELIEYVTSGQFEADITS